MVQRPEQAARFGIAGLLKPPVPVCRGARCFSKGKFANLQTALRNRARVPSPQEDVTGEGRQAE